MENLFDKRNNGKSIQDPLQYDSDCDEKSNHGRNSNEQNSRSRKNGNTMIPLTNNDDETNIRNQKMSQNGLERSQIVKKKKKNVFDILDADHVKRTVPYMHPDTKKHTFKFFEERVHEVVDGKGLLENDILDVMEFRMGGSYLVEMKQLRSQNWDLDYVENYYLQKDIEMEKESKKKKELIEKRNMVDFPYVGSF